MLTLPSPPSQSVKQASSRPPSSPLFVLLCGLGASLAAIPSVSLDSVGCHLLHSVTAGINGQG